MSERPEHRECRIVGECWATMNEGGLPRDATRSPRLDMFGVAQAVAKILDERDEARAMLAEMEVTERELIAQRDAMHTEVERLRAELASLRRERENDAWVKAALVRRLRDGLRAWARDEDGIHQDAWEAYADACEALGEPRPCFECGTTGCPKCGRDALDDSNLEVPSE